MGRYGSAFTLAYQPLAELIEKAKKFLAEVEAELIMIISSTKFEIKIQPWGYHF